MNLKNFVKSDYEYLDTWYIQFEKKGMQDLDLVKFVVAIFCENS